MKVKYSRYLRRRCSNDRFFIKFNYYVRIIVLKNNNTTIAIYCFPAINLHDPFVIVWRYEYDKQYILYEKHFLYYLLMPANWIQNGIYSIPNKFSQISLKHKSSSYNNFIKTYPVLGWGSFTSDWIVSFNIIKRTHEICLYFMNFLCKIHVLGQSIRVEVFWKKLLTSKLNFT